MNPECEIVKGYIWGCACTWPDVQDWSRPAQGCTLQGVAGRGPADQPQTEPVCSEIIHLTSWRGKKADRSKVTYRKSTGNTNEHNTLLSLTRLVHIQSLVKCIYLPKNDLTSHWRSRNSDLLQHEHAQSGIILRSFLGGQKCSEETET